MDQNKQPFRISSYRMAMGFIIAIFLLSFGIYTSRSTSPAQPVKQNISAVTPAPTKIPKRVAGQIVVKFWPPIPKATIQERLNPFGASIISVNEQINTTLVKVPEGQEDFIIQKLKADGLVEYAESNYIFERRFIPNDTNFIQQWYLQKIQAPQAWDVTRGTGIKVGIVDSGIDLPHPDLASKIVAQKDMNGGANAQDTDGHGSHLSGTIGAATNNALGIAGICPNCQLVVVRTNDSAVSNANGITWAADQGVKVINMSWGGPTDSQTLRNAVTYAYNKGVLAIAAVQNENTNNSVDFPSSYSNVMNVTDTNEADVKYPLAGYGTWVWIAAPGEHIYSTIPSNKYQSMSGTSMATSVMSGVAALVYSTKYGTSPDAVRQRLCDTADKITGTGTQFKCGRVNAFKAVRDDTVQPTVTIPVQPTITVPVPTLSTGVIPSVVCAGSTNNICEPTPTIPATNDVSPTEDVNISPGPENEVPSVYPSTELSPAPADDTTFSEEEVKDLQSLLKLIMKLIKMLLKMVSTKPHHHKHGDDDDDDDD